MKMGIELSPIDFFLFPGMRSQLLGRHFQVVPEIHKDAEVIPKGYFGPY